MVSETPDSATDGAGSNTTCGRRCNFEVKRNNQIQRPVPCGLGPTTPACFGSTPNSRSGMCHPQGNNLTCVINVPNAGRNSVGGSTAGRAETANIDFELTADVSRAHAIHRPSLIENSDSAPARDQEGRGHSIAYTRTSVNVVFAFMGRTLRDDKRNLSLAMKAMQEMLVRDSNAPGMG